VTPATEDKLRPAPSLTADNHFFWEAAAEGKLVIQACGDCGALCHLPSPLCPKCHSSNRVVQEMSGTGRVASYINVHHPPNPWFELPIVIASIELDEGVTVTSNLCDIPFEEIELGMEVEVFFAPTEDGLGVPLFRPRTT
jgi:uncharacterized OB-fold protein